jgi:hypothetical protein
MVPTREKEGATYKDRGATTSFVFGFIIVVTTVITGRKVLEQHVSHSFSSPMYELAVEEEEYNDEIRQQR